MENKEIIAALIAAQSEMGIVVQSATNSHFRNKYAKIEDIIITAAPVLNKHGLAITQYAYTDDNDKSYLVTKLLHTSGQSIECKLLMHLKDPSNMQEFGKASTYIRRYTYAAMCGIVSGEKDDDGEESAQESRSYQEPERKENSTSVKPLSDKQLDLLSGLLGNDQKGQEKIDFICKKYNILSLAELDSKTASEYISSLLKKKEQS